MDLATSLHANATSGSRCPLRSWATGEDLADEQGPVVLLLAGRDSEQYRKAELAIQRRQLDEGKRSRNYRLTPEQLEQNELDLLVACTLGWENVSYGGETAFSTDLIRRFYQRERWAAEQAQAFIGDRANFSGA